MIGELLRSHLPALFLGIIIGKHLDMMTIIILGVFIFFMLNEPFGKSRLAPRDFVIMIAERILRLFEKRISSLLEETPIDRTHAYEKNEQRVSSSVSSSQHSTPITSPVIQTPVVPITPTFVHTGAIVVPNIRG